ncbi:MAG: AAA family ATPase [Comamonas sp.]|uniref:AAA family ATPase n=1 Tax=Comamonas sp. TaxID=34028 RepID=UPI002FCB4645
MNARNEAAFAAVDASIAAALAYRPPVRAQSAPPGPTFPPLDDMPKASKDQPKPDRVMLVSAASLTPVPVAWLWKYWLARKKLHILAGAPGQGKTTIAIDMAATVSSGGRWPDGTSCSIGNVLIWSGEDDPSDTLNPRLSAAGADLTRCHFIIGTERSNGETVPFDPSLHLDGLRAVVEDLGGVSLLIVDPVVSAVTGDSHKNTEVRRALQPLVDLASEFDCAIVGITHFSKGGQGGDPSQRVVGSVAFTAVARVVMVAAKVKGNGGEDRRVLARSKSNIGPDDGGFEYRLEQIENADGIHASRIAWGQAVAGTARDLLTDPNEDDAEDNPESSALDDASEFLVELLSGGPSPTKYVETEAKAAGLAWRTVRRASEVLEIKKRKLEGVWYWMRPNLSNQLVHVVQSQNLGQVGQVGQVDAQDALEDAQGAQLSKQGILGTFGASSEESTKPATSPKEAF